MGASWGGVGAAAAPVPPPQRAVQALSSVDKPASEMAREPAQPSSVAASSVTCTSAKYTVHAAPTIKNTAASERLASIAKLCFESTRASRVMCV
jgi:hypothetical protein